MSRERKIAAVVNPRAAGGKAAKLWPQISQLLERRLGPVAARLTEASGSGTRLARELLMEGFDLIVAVGGDGTANEVANGFLDADKPVNPDACLGVLSLGTGGDFQRSLGIPSKIDEAVEVLATGVPLRIDAVKANFAGRNGSKVSRYFVNLASFGMGGAVASRSRNFLSPLGGTAAFLWATFAVILNYRGRRVRLELDGSNLPNDFLITNIAVGNGPYHGGGMHPCPWAEMNDGLLEVTVIDYLTPFELLRDIRILYSDNVYIHPKVHHFRAQRVVATSDDITQIEVDGEPLGCLPFEAVVLPNCLPVLVPAASPLVRLQIDAPINGA